MGDEKSEKCAVRDGILNVIRFFGCRYHQLVFDYKSGSWFKPVKPPRKSTFLTVTNEMRKLFNNVRQQKSVCFITITVEVAQRQSAVSGFILISIVRRSPISPFPSPFFLPTLVYVCVTRKSLGDGSYHIIGSCISWSVLSCRHGLCIIVCAIIPGFHYSRDFSPSI